MINLSALVLSCTLKASPAPSSSDKLGLEVLTALDQHGVSGELIRLADHIIAPGVLTDMGGDDDWPMIRAKVLAADILVVTTSIWMGHPASYAQRLMERLDAELGETDSNGRFPTMDKVAAVAVVGNEDGAHMVHSQLYQALNDVGFTLAASARVYWVGEAMGDVDYVDLDETPDKVAASTRLLASNTAHLARVLRANPYPAIS